MGNCTGLCMTAQPAKDDKQNVVSQAQMAEAAAQN